MKSSQNDKSSPLLWMIINQLKRLDAKISHLQKKNSVLNAKISVLETDVRKLKG
jgi:peptidoglycan hydrolase CwlO-like protein